MKITLSPRELAMCDMIASMRFWQGCGTDSTIIDKRKRFFELNEPPARGLFLFKKKWGDGWQTGAPPKNTGRIPTPSKKCDL